jgi:hypothetical protein
VFVPPIVTVPDFTVAPPTNYPYDPSAFAAQSSQDFNVAPTPDQNLGSAQLIRARGSLYPRALEDWTRDTINVKSFGAKGDGVTDDTAAFNACLAWCQANPAYADVNFPLPRDIYVPAGQYILSAALTISFPCTLRGAGISNTRLRWNAAGGISITSAYSYTGSGVRDMELAAGTTACGTAITVSYPNDASSWWPKMQFENLFINGNIFGNYWNNGISLVNPWNVLIKRCQIIGVNSSTYANWLTYGISVTGGLSNSGLWLEEVDIVNAQIAFAATMNHFEGVVFENCAFYSVGTGIYFSETGGSRSLDIKIINQHCAAINYGINLNHVVSVYISGCEQYVGNGSGVPISQNPYNLWINDGSEIGIYGRNRFIKANAYSGGGTSGSRGILMQNTDAITIGEGTLIGFHDQGNDRAIDIQNTPTTCTIAPIMYYDIPSVPAVGNGIPPAAQWSVRGVHPAGSAYNTGPALTKPNQPSVLAGHAIGIANVTGDGTTYQVDNWLTLVDNVGAFNAGTGLFTASADGWYQFSGALAFNGYAFNHTYMFAAVVYAGVSYDIGIINPWAVSVASAPGNRYDHHFSITLYMTQGSNAYLSIQVSGGAKTVSCLTGTYMSIVLLY